jgi:hypothetical protein
MENKILGFRKESEVLGEILKSFLKKIFSVPQQRRSFLF